MEHIVSNQPHGTEIRLSGQFTFSDNQKFRHILELVQLDHVQAVELNFSDIDFIDSAGLGMLLLLREECQNKNVPLSIRGARGQVEKIFMISKFDQLFTLHA